MNDEIRRTNDETGMASAPLLAEEVDGLVDSAAEVVLHVSAAGCAGFSGDFRAGGQQGVGEA